MGVWLGRKRIPPLPFETVLEDRSNGNYYQVTKSGSSPSVTQKTGTIDRSRFRVYEAYRGPTVLGENDRPYRLYVDSGVLGFEPMT